MTWGQPRGFRVPGRISLPIMSHALEKYAWPTWREAAIRALAAVAVDLLAVRTSDEGREEVLRELSRGHIGEVDLAICRAQRAGVILRAAEFLDVCHAYMHRPSALPVPPRLDLRCTAQFMDDPADAERTWIYVLLGTEMLTMEQMFAALPDVEDYPVPTAQQAMVDPQAQERAVIWQRLIGRYNGFSPPSIIAPEMNLTFDLIESIASGADEQLSGRGKLTFTEVVDAITLEGIPREGLRELLVQPIA